MPHPIFDFADIAKTILCLAFLPPSDFSWSPLLDFPPRRFQFLPKEDIGTRLQLLHHSVVEHNARVNPIFVLIEKWRGSWLDSEQQGPSIMSFTRPRFYQPRLFLKGFFAFGSNRWNQNNDERSEGNDQDRRTDRALQEDHWVAA